MTQPNPILAALPGKLKQARKQQGLSLDAIANLSGVSRSMVSQIERGESSPTIATLWNLTRALQVDFAGLLEGEPKGARIQVRTCAEVPSIQNIGQSCHIAILSGPEAGDGPEVYEIRFGVDGALHSQPHGHGAREQLTVISGQVRVTSGDATAMVRAGDTASYPADSPHAIEALGEEARIFLIVTSS